MPRPCRFAGADHRPSCAADGLLPSSLAFFKGLKLSKAQQQVAGELLREITNRLQVPGRRRASIT